MLDGLVLGLFAIWLLLSLLRQPKWRGADAIARADVFALIPQWGMFGNPAQHDFQVRFRVERRDGSRSPWANAPVTPDRPRAGFVWHPQLIVHKAALDAVNGALGARDREGRRQFQHSSRFAGLCGRLSACADDRNAVALQVMMLAGRRYDAAVEPSVVFLSDFVALPSDGSDLPQR